MEGRGKAPLNHPKNGRPKDKVEKDRQSIFKARRHTFCILPTVRVHARVRIINIVSACGVGLVIAVALLVIRRLVIRIRRLLILIVLLRVVVRRLLILLAVIAYLCHLRRIHRCTIVAAGLVKRQSASWQYCRRQKSPSCRKRYKMFFHAQAKYHTSTKESMKPT